MKLQDETPEQAELRKAKRREYYARNKEKLRAAVLAYYRKNREKVLAGNRASRQKHREARATRNKAKYYANHEATLLERRATYQRHKDRYNQKQRELRRTFRLEAFAAYGGAICGCCGETTIEFLGIDHIDGGGTKHRDSIARYFYKWLKDEGYPPGYRVLCHNCNMARGFYGACPHDSRRHSVTTISPSAVGPSPL